jgi:long-chain acyl-CoA synthetase
MLYRIVEQWTRHDPDKTAIIGTARSLSYRQFSAEARRCASHLASLGLQPQNSIIVGLPPCPESFILFYGAWAIGATVVPVLPSGAIPLPIQSLRPKAAVGDERFLGEAQKRWPDLTATLPWDSESGLHVGSGAAAFKRKRLFRKEKVMAGSSSGTTTGIPTLGFSSAEQIVRRQQLRARIMGLRSSDVFLATRPLIGAGAYVQLVLPIVAGGTVVVMEKFERFKAAAAIEKEKVTVLYAVPPIYELLASIPTTHHVDFSSLRLCISGGSRLTSAVAQQFYRRFGIHIRQTYTGRQLTPAFTFNASGPPDAVGHVAGPYPVALLDDEGKEVKAGAIGEIVFDVSKVKDPMLRAALRSHRNRKGKYVYSGDLGRLDEQGYLYVVGRKSRFIKVGANRVEPAEVEAVLATHPKVRETIVFAVRPGESDEGVGAIVVPDGPVTSQELVAYCAQKLDSYKCPPNIELRDHLPRNTEGKVMRYLFESASADAPAGED